jgi:very-short-patch-repair endonuclease
MAYSQNQNDAECGQLESPIEAQLEQAVRPKLHVEATWQRQVEVETPGGNYRLDFVASMGARVVGLECDGREFHNWFDDKDRDLNILRAGCVNAIMRFPGANIHHAHPEELTAYLGWYEPTLFYGGDWKIPIRIPEFHWIKSLMATTYRTTFNGIIYADNNPYRTYERGTTNG